MPGVVRKKLALMGPFFGIGSTVLPTGLMP
jgi:hypothetical protein